MNKKYIALAVIMGASMQSWAANPCMPIAKACMKAGYYKGGNNVGKGLIMNCVMPITQGTKTLPNVTFPSNVLQQCQATLAAKMKSQ